MRKSNINELLEIVSREFLCSKRCADLVSLTCDEETNLTQNPVISSAKRENVFAVASILENINNSGAYSSIRSYFSKFGIKVRFIQFAREYAKQAFIYGVPQNIKERKKIISETKKAILRTERELIKSVEEEYLAIEGLSRSPRYAH